jgi:CrcB protein
MCRKPSITWKSFATCCPRALGTLARHLLETHLPAGPRQFPWTTLAVNLSGSLAIGFLVPLTEGVSLSVLALRSFLLVGLLGGWTTSSTLAVEATLLVKNGALGACLAYTSWPLWAEASDWSSSRRPSVER